MRAMAWIGLSLGVVTVGGCAPTIDTGCSNDLDCDRGQLCELESAECVDQNLAQDSTESPAPADFTSKVVPFFRGRVCTVHSVKAGTEFPVFIEPCLHPCLDPGMFQFKHSWSCIGSSCEAYAIMWIDAAGMGCPADAFGKFDRGQCVYPQHVEFTINPTYMDGSAIEGQMRLEIPFLSNADIGQIAADPDNTDLREQLIHKYPESQTRVPGGADISLLNSNPAAPSTCGADGSMCECSDVGF